MSDELKMPERLPGDGAVKVEHLPNGRVLLVAEGEGFITVSLYNAWRLLGMMSLILGLPLSKKAAKAIKF